MLSRAPPKVSIVFQELEVEVAQEWTISLPSYLWQLHFFNNNFSIVE